MDAVAFKEKNAIKLENYGAFPLLLEGAQSANAQAPEVEISSLVQIDIDEDIINEYLYEELLKNIEVATSPADIFTNEEGHVVIEGKGRDGRMVPRDRLVDAIALAANHGVDTVPVPVVIDPAPLSISEDLQEKGIRELITTGHSSYYGSPTNRMFNIDFGTKMYNGLLIPPGEEFSFNEVLGTVDYKSGFKVEKIIKKNKLEYEVGGGICQVSTTMYRAALLAGLPITERNPHSWKVSYYSQSMGDGLDATIYPGVADIKFINDTPGHLLIQAYTDGPEAYFKLYGTKDGRQVEMDGPHGGGLTYRWNRTVTRGEESETEEIWSRYRPIPPPEPVKPVTPAPVPEPTSTAADDGF